jgi:hypothetical protein
MCWIPISLVPQAHHGDMSLRCQKPCLHDYTVGNKKEKGHAEGLVGMIMALGFSGRGFRAILWDLQSWIRIFLKFTLVLFKTTQ